MSGAVERVDAAHPALGQWSAEQVDLIRRFVAPDSSDTELAFFAEVARHRELDPLAGEIIGVPRWDPKTRRARMTIQVTVAGLRVIAERSGLYGGQDAPQWCGPDGVWHDVWLDVSNPPFAARVAVWRKDWAAPTVGVARYPSYVQVDRDGRPRGVWDTGPDFMLAKCAEAAALRRAFPTQMAAAGVNAGRDLSVPSHLSMQARQAGLDDHGRHALVEQVTEGRTSSTRDLTDAEAVTLRGALERLRGEAEAAAGLEPWPEVDPEAEDADWEQECEEFGCHDQSADPTTPFPALNAALRTRLNELDGPQRRSMRAWMADQLIPAIDTALTEEVALVAAELDRRDRDGWGEGEGL